MVARFRIALAETSSLRIMELQLAGSRCEQIMLLRLVCFGLCPCQHNGTYTRNVHPATPPKKPAQILRFAESKKEPLSRKILGKAARNALGKGTGPSDSVRDFQFPAAVADIGGQADNQRHGSFFAYGYSLCANLPLGPRNLPLKTLRHWKSQIVSIPQF